MAKILLIDDDDTVRTMLRLTLTEFGHTVIEARNGREGVKDFPASAADLVITDIVMPEMDGIELIVKLRKLNPGMKIIAMSGGGRIGPADYLRTAGFLGAVKTLTKPFSIAELSAVVTEVLASPAVAPSG